MLEFCYEEIKNGALSSIFYFILFLISKNLNPQTKTITTLAQTKAIKEVLPAFGNIVGLISSNFNLGETSEVFEFVLLE